MKILQFNSENLAISLSNKYTSSQLIKTRFHFSYLNGYLSNPEINAKQIIIEEEYISKDFLTDYVSYYSLCFEKYPKFCHRVHFLDKELSEIEINDAILGKNSEFQKHYLGFIVVKPIPITVIGYTVLKTFTKGTGRLYWGLRDYNVHIFGTEVKIRSLAFQEQDSVLAACATTAVWSMLNKASLDFHTILKSPSQITKDADDLASDGSRLFPNKGLNLMQICKAILKSGLVSEIKGDKTDVTNSYLKKIVNAYSAIGIPIILVVSVPNGGTYGLHALTVLGFKQEALEVIPPGHEISWLSDKIAKLYVHDDQFGPFLRVDFSGHNELVTEWTNIHPKHQPSFTKKIVVPLFPKIRLSYEDIEAMVLGLDRILSFFFDNQIISDLIWDIKILLSEKYKDSVKNNSLDDKIKLEKLTKSLPKYLWIADCYIGPYKILEFTFDATNISRAMHGLDVISFLPEEINDLLRQHLEANESNYNFLFEHDESKEYYKFLKDNI